MTKNARWRVFHQHQVLKQPKQQAESATPRRNFVLYSFFVMSNTNAEIDRNFFWTARPTSWMFNAWRWSRIKIIRPANPIYAQWQWYYVTWSALEEAIPLRYQRFTGTPSLLNQNCVRQPSPSALATTAALTGGGFSINIKNYLDTLVTHTNPQLLTRRNHLMATVQSQI